MNLLRSVAHLPQTLAWKGVNYWVRRSFPSVQTISTQQLAHRLSQNTAAPVLIDTRSQEEYALSHLPDAHHAKTLDDAEAILEKANPFGEKAVVLYCSVGYRSGRLGTALQQAGHTVLNLEGSIFQWANEGRQLQPSNAVHPYNRLWGCLLSPANRS